MNDVGFQASKRARRDVALLATVLVCVLGTLAFILLASVVVNKSTQMIDENILRAVRELTLKDATTGQVWAEESAVAITSLGAIINLVLISGAVVGLLLLTGRTHAAAFLTVALAGALALNYLLKLLFGRARPEVVERLQHVDSMSFPSGHALISTAVYAALGVIAANLLKDRRLRIYVMSLAAGIAILVGLSRVYLGVHYPTDVLGGWTVGFVWALLCWFVSRRLQRLGILEPPK